MTRRSSRKMTQIDHICGVILPPGSNYIRRNLLKGTDVVRPNCDHRREGNTHGTGNMSKRWRRNLLHLPEWELPRFDDIEYELIEKLAAIARRKGTETESLENGFSFFLHGRLRKMVEFAVDETIEYWLKGLGDGNNGDWPELCVELPYLERGEKTEPLTLTYCVQTSRDVRTELNRTTFEDVLSRILECAIPGDRLPSRARIVAARLRELAQQLEAL